jgi:hypothetical protein
MWDAMLVQVPNLLWQVSVIKNILNEHGGGMGGRLGVQQGKPKEIFNTM